MMSLAAKGTMDATLSGAQVSVKADAKVEVAAPVTMVGQTMTTIKGTLVSVQGTLVKLG